MGARIKVLLFSVPFAGLCLLSLSNCNTKCSNHPGYGLNIPVTLRTWNDTFHVGDTLQLYFNFNNTKMPAANTNERIDISQFDISPIIKILNIGDSSQFDLGLNGFKIISKIKYGIEKSTISSFISIYSFNYDSEHNVKDTLELICLEKGAYILASSLWKCSGRTTPGAVCKQKGWACKINWDKENYIFDPNHYLDLAQSDWRKKMLNVTSKRYDIRYAFLVK